jgi:hypothetical protein
VPRPAFTGAQPDWRPSDAMPLEHGAHPVDFFLLFLPLTFWRLVTDNTKKYLGWCRASGKNAHPNAETKHFTLSRILLFVAALLLIGIHPTPSHETLFKTSLGFPGHRVAQMFSRAQWRETRAFVHISDPMKMPKRGERQFDELYKVRPLLDTFLENSVKYVTAGAVASIDEITIGFQGSMAALKQRCGKFKRAGDGFQADALVMAGGYIIGMVFRGDNTLPTFDKSLSPLHNRCLQLFSIFAVMGVAYARVYWDNLYPSRPPAGQRLHANGARPRRPGRGHRRDDQRAADVDRRHLPHQPRHPEGDPLDKHEGHVEEEDRRDQGETD